MTDVTGFGKEKHTGAGRGAPLEGAAGGSLLSPERLCSAAPTHTRPRTVAQDLSFGKNGRADKAGGGQAAGKRDQEIQEKSPPGEPDGGQSRL